MPSPLRYGDIGVIALVAERWGALLNPSHQVLSRLARDFHVVWVNPAHEWRKRPVPAPRWPLPDVPGFEVYVPERWLPAFYRPPWLSAATFRARLARARRRLVARGCRRIILYLWQPAFAPAIDMVAHDLSCYHIVDEYSFSADAPPLDPIETALIQRVDQVFVHSAGLLERKGQLNPNTTLVPNGVDYAALATPVPEPGDLAGIPRPRIGYTGWIKKQLDWTLLTALVDRHPAWSFVFVGSMSPHPSIAPVLESLRQRPNVHFLGRKPAAELAKYPQHFDVCLMPYVVDAYTNNIYPLKLHEYLASGRPAVGSPIRSLSDFAGPIALASTVDEWSTAIDSALHQGSEGREARQAIARTHDWNGLVASIADVIQDRLRPERTSTERGARAAHTNG